MKFETREAYLTEAAALILDDLIMPAADVYMTKARPNYRISIGFPKHTRGGKAIATCFSTEASSDQVNEIFITPEIDNPVAVMEALVHELIHAVDNCESGHRNFFAKVAREVGLEGKLRSTHAGEELAATLRYYAELLGEFPHHRMNIDQTHVKSGNRQLKVECHDCGMTFRASKKWIDRIDTWTAQCPCCQETGTLRTE